MSRDQIQDAQDFLTMISENRVKRIIDVETLLERHPKDSVLEFLEDLYRQKGRALNEMIRADKTSSSINELIAAMFRIHMAMKTIKTDERKEVKAA
jgi:predicted site-specific integrase-resolvase